MALNKKNITTKLGIVLEDSYIKIRHISGNKNELVASIELYANKDMANQCYSTNNFIQVWNIRIPDIDLEQNIYRQVYDYIKTLPDFIGALDI